MKKTKWTEEVIQFMIDNYKGKDNIELAKLLNEKFNLNTNGDRVSNVKSNLLRRNGIDLRTWINTGCIKKGSIPANKGKKMSKDIYNKCQATMFKKGNVPPNKRPLGSERITKDGYIEIKIAEPNKWQTKSRYIWEQQYGKIPKGGKIIYLDGNRLNTNIENLKLVTSGEELVMNRRELRSNKKEVTESGMLLARYICMVGKKKGERDAR